MVGQIMYRIVQDWI